MAKLINRELIEKHIDYKELTDEIGKYYQSLIQGTVSVTDRIFSPTKDEGMYLIGGATNFENENFIVMSQPVMPWLSEKALPVATTSYMYSSFRTGKMLAVVGGTDIVKYRTPAKSALATRYLASKKKEYTLGLIGLGVQAVSHSEAFSENFNITKIVGNSRTPDKWQKNLDEIKDKTGIEVEILSKDDVISKCDILVVITSCKEPLITFSQLHKGQLIIGTDHAETVARDVVLKADKVFIDYKPTAENENATIKILLNDGQKYKDIVNGDLAMLANGDIKGRDSDDEIIFFQSLGVMCENLAAVEYLYEKVGDDTEEFEI